MSARKRILFVDDESRVREDLQNLLHPLASEWDMTFVAGGEDALARLDAGTFDVLVTDLGMPGMTGPELLRVVHERHPTIVRFVLAAPQDQPLVMSCAAFAHQFLTRPCEPGVLREAIARACDMETAMRREQIGRLVARMDHLPSLPDVYLQLVEKLRDSECSLDDAAELVARDISLTARVLKLVNSAFFGLRHQIASLHEAVNYLGLDTIKALVLTVNAFSQFEQKPLGGLSLESLWNHSMLTAGCAKLIAELEGGSARLIDQAFVAGMLHDTGKLVLGANFGPDYASAVANSDGSAAGVLAAEAAAFGATHADVGGHLFSLWALPVAIVEAVEWHHDPVASAGTSFSPLACVHAANIWARESDENGSGLHLDREFYVKLGLADRLSAWHRACVETHLGGVEARARGHLAL